MQWSARARSSASAFRTKGRIGRIGSPAKGRRALSSRATSAPRLRPRRAPGQGRERCAGPGSPSRPAGPRGRAGGGPDRGGGPVRGWPGLKLAVVFRSDGVGEAAGRELPLFRREAMLRRRRAAAKRNPRRGHRRAERGAICRTGSESRRLACLSALSLTRLAASLRAANRPKDDRTVCAQRRVPYPRLRPARQRQHAGACRPRLQVACRSRLRNDASEWPLRLVAAPVAALLAGAGDQRGGVRGRDRRARPASWAWTTRSGLSVTYFPAFIVATLYAGAALGLGDAGPGAAAWRAQSLGRGGRRSRCRR